MSHRRHGFGLLMIFMITCGSAAFGQIPPLSIEPPSQSRRNHARHRHDCEKDAADKDRSLGAESGTVSRAYGLQA